MYFQYVKQNVDKLSSLVLEQSVPQYHQSITNVQQEFIQAYENIADSAVSLQKQYAKKAGIAANIPEATIKVIQDTTEEIVKAASIQNQVTLATIDAAQQNIKTFNDNANSFAELNRKHSTILDFCILYKNKLVEIYFFNFSLFL